MNATPQLASRALSFDGAIGAGQDAVRAKDYAAAASFYGHAFGLRGGDTILFGDSHFNMLVGVPGLTSLWMSAITAHRIGRDGRSFIDALAYGARPTTRLGFCFGEIDVRNHIGRIAEERGQAIEAVSEEVVTRYLDGVLSISQGHSRPFVTTTVSQGVITPGQTDIGEPRPLAERIVAGQCFNRLLLELGPKMGVDVIDIVPAVAGTDGLLRADVSDDGIHVRTEAAKNAVASLAMQQLDLLQQRDAV